MAADRGKRPRDARGRFLPKEEAEKPKRSRTKSTRAKPRGKSTAASGSKPTGRSTRAKPRSPAKGTRTSRAAKAPAAKGSRAKAPTAKGSRAKGSRAKSPVAKGSRAKAKQPVASKAPPPASETTAPSIGQHTTIGQSHPAERFAAPEQSDVDAMGLAKRRGVVGRSYGPSLTKQLTLYGAFLGVMAALAIGFVVLANELDQPPETQAEEAPWAVSDTPPPRPVDFPRMGRTEVD